MARTVRTVRVVGNPPRRRARAHHRGAGKHRRNKSMSAKQIKYFGTPAQKAALKRSRSAKRANASRRATRTHARHTRRRTRRNIGEILSLTLPMGNPPRRKARRKAKANHRRTKGATMAKAHRRRRRRATNTGGTRRRRRTNVRHHATTHRRRRSYRTNAGGHRRRTYRTRRHDSRHRNAGGGMGFGAEIMDTVWLVAGAVGTQMLTQMVLGTSNTGLMGYAGNGVAGCALSFVASKLLKQPKIGRAIFKGAILQIVLRAIRDYTPFGSVTANLGMGDYIASNWVTPQIYADPNNSAMVVPPNGWGTGMVAAPAKGVSGFPHTGEYNPAPGMYQ